MTNDHIKPEISAYLAGGLPEARSRQIEAHLASCDTCEQAMSKARAKQARGKREALKKASPDPLPNLFLARLGKEAGVDRTPSRKPWVVLGVLFLCGVSYGLFRYRSIGAGPLATLAGVEPSVVPVSTAPVTVPASEVPKPQVPAVSAPLTVQQEWRGAESGIKGALVRVVRNDEAWLRLWRDMLEPGALPPVNFERNVVVGVFGGEQPGGAKIVLGRLRETKDEVAVPYHVESPEVAASTATVRSHPYLLSMLPRVEKKIRLTPTEARQ